MLNTVKAVMRDGKVELLESIEIPEGSAILVTVLTDDKEFWLKASEQSLHSIWGNDADVTYDQLLDR